MSAAEDLPLVMVTPVTSNVVAAISSSKIGLTEGSLRHAKVTPPPLRLHQIHAYAGREIHSTPQELYHIFELSKRNWGSSSVGPLKNNYKRLKIVIPTL